MNIALKRIETMLQIWEQILFVAGAELRLAHPDVYTGVLKHWRRLRTDILNRDKDFVPEDYRFPLDHYVEYFLTALSYDMLPPMLAGWSRSSRRVYSLTEDMQQMLELTAIGRVRWQDLYPPFPYFAVSLPLPLKGEHGNLLDTLFVEVRKNSLNIIALGNELEVFKPLPKGLRIQIGNAVSACDFAKLARISVNIRNQNYCYIPASAYLSEICGDPSKPVALDYTGDDAKIEVINEAGVHKGGEETVRFWRPFVRIVVGLILHLELISRGTGKKSTVVSEPREKWTADPHAVIHEADILSVRLEQDLTEHERHIFRVIRAKGIDEAMKELCSHYRSAHWRRPPGKGNDPSYPQTVHVRWTIVNKRRLPPDGLPSGTNITV